jgi:hypothetical protein
MPKVVQSDLANARRLQDWHKVAVREVVRIEDAPIRRQEHLFLGDFVDRFHASGLHAFLAYGDERMAQFPRHVHRRLFRTYFSKLGWLAKVSCGIVISRYLQLYPIRTQIVDLCRGSLMF